MQPLSPAYAEVVAEYRSNPLAQTLRVEVLSGKFENPLYVTIMSKHSFDDVIEMLPQAVESGHQLRVLTLNPSLAPAAIEAFARNLPEYRRTPWRAVHQVRDAAEQWRALKEKYPHFLQVKTYDSIPMFQGILVPDQIISIELIPYCVHKAERPGLIIGKDHAAYKRLEQAFDELWKDGVALVVPRVDDNTQYTQACMELRRYRDYELNVAVWFGALQLGLATVIAKTDLSQTILIQRIPSAFLAGLITLLGISAIISICYGKARYEELSAVTSSRFGYAYDWPKLSRTALQPFVFILAVLAFLPIANVFFAGVLLKWSGFRLATLVSSSLLAVLVAVVTGVMRIRMGKARRATPIPSK